MFQMSSTLFFRAKKKGNLRLPFFSFRTCYAAIATGCATALDGVKVAAIVLIVLSFIDL
jgi:hypothetical protein